MKVISKQNNSKMCLICGLQNDLGLKASFYNMEDGSVGALFTFKEVHQSYPERVHGGMLTALLDELAGRALWVTNPELLGVTANLQTKFRKPVPYGEELVGRGIITKRIGRLFTADAKILNKNKEVLAESTATYVIMPNSQIASNEHMAESEFILVEDDVKEIDF